MSSYEEARVELLARCKGRCEGCGRRLDLSTMHAHHRLPRSAGRDDSSANLLALCHRCHNWCHANPIAARDCGWIVRRGQVPAQVEVTRPVHLLAWQRRYG